MSSDEALGRLFFKLGFPPVCPRDVEERIAIRFEEVPIPEYTIRSEGQCVRMYVRSAPVTDRSPGAWFSRYAHGLGDAEEIFVEILDRIGWGTP